MKKIIVYGAGSQWGNDSELIKVSRIINTKNATVIAYFVEGDQIIGQDYVLNGATLLSDTGEIAKIEYDYIVIAAYEYARITKLLESLNVKPDKIIQFFNYHFYCLEGFFFKDKRVLGLEENKLFIGVAAARMTLKY